MEPWGAEPRSIARGILDDETYDWLPLAEGVLESGGGALAVSEERLAEAHALAHEATGIPVCATGAAGLAGLIELRARGAIGAHERVAVLFTGRSVTTRPRRCPMRRIFVAHHPAEAYAVAGVLSSRGIEAEVQGELLFSLMDEAPLTPDALPSVWVRDDAQLGSALVALRDPSIGRVPGRRVTRPWACPACDERIDGRLAVCWECGGERRTRCRRARPDGFAAGARHGVRGASGRRTEGRPVSSRSARSRRRS